MSVSADDARLIARATSSSDNAAFGEIVARYRSRVYGYLLRMVRSPALAEDLAQDTFVRAWQNIDRFRGDGSFEGWLLRIAYTTFLQDHRRRKRRGDETPPDSAARDRDSALSVPAGDESPDLDRVLAALPPDIRSMVMMAYGYGYTHAEIASAMSMPVGTVKSHISRARSRLRELFDETGSHAA